MASARWAINDATIACRGDQPVAATDSNVAERIMILAATKSDRQLTLWRDLTPLMNPKSVAIVGASQRSPAGRALSREPRGNRVIRNMRNFGYPGRIIAINPKYSEVMDCPCYPDIASVPEPVDCVILAVPNQHVPDLLESAAAAG